MDKMRDLEREDVSEDEVLPLVRREEDYGDKAALDCSRMWP